MLKDLIKILKAGGVAVIPTDTIYGVVGQALNKKVVKKIYQLKNRDTKKPSIILISSINDLKKFGVKLSQEQKTILNLIWPGPVSVVFSPHLSFRLPRSKKLQALIKQTGPLIAPSANPEGLPPAKNVLEARQYFGTQVDYCLAGGTKAGQASALIKIIKNKIEVLRPGKLPKSVLKYLHPAMAGQVWLITTTLLK